MGLSVRALKAALAAVVALAGVVVVPQSGAEERASEEGPSGAAQQAARDSAASSVRRAFFLDDEHAALRVVEALPRAEQAEFLGAPVSQQELARIEDQLLVLQAIEERGDEVRAEMYGEFAGLWRHPEGGVRVATTGEHDAARAAVAAAMPDVEVVVESVTFSEHDLAAVSAQVTAEVLGGGELGATSVATEPMANRIVVGVAEGAEEATAVLQGRYGSAVVARESEAVFASRTSGAPWKAGKEIAMPHHDPSSVGCTGAFGVTRGGDDLVLTAGHCLRTDPLGTPVEVGPHTLGVSAERQMFGYADVGAIELSTTAWKGNNCIYTSASVCEQVYAYMDPAIGTPVCFSGARSATYAEATHCGVVDLIVHGRWIGGYGFTMAVFDMLEASGFGDGSPCNGDSGSPMFSRFPPPLSSLVVGRGILSYLDARQGSSGCGPDAGVGFSRWSNIQDALGIEGGCVGYWGDSEGCYISGMYEDIRYHHRFKSAITWAHENAIDTGLSPSRFWPGLPAGRGMAVVWLWRMAGSPTSHPPAGFVDVPSGGDLADAVGWALDVGVLTSATYLHPDDALTNGDWASWLYRAAGSPYDGLGVAQVPLPFGGLCDMSPSSSHFRAAAWSVNHRVLRGVPVVDWGCADADTGATRHFEVTSTVPRQVGVAVLFEAYRSGEIGCVIC